MFKTVALKLKPLKLNPVAVTLIGILGSLLMRLIMSHADVTRVSFISNVTRNPYEPPTIKKSVSK